MTKTREEKLEYSRKYYREHRQAWIEYNRFYYGGHRQEIIERNKKYSREHLKEVAERHRKYRREHLKEAAGYSSIYLRGHRQDVIERRQKYRRKVLEKLGGKCVRCGFSDVRALQVDHVHGGGCMELMELGHGRSRFYKEVLADSEGRYQLLCANCNWIKRAENNEVKLAILKRREIHKGDIQQLTKFF